MKDGTDMQPRTVMRSLALAVLTLAALAGCGGVTGAPSALGLESPPAGLDPASPRLAAKDVAFSVGDVQVPASEPFILVFENQEAVPHNVSLYADAAFANRVFEGVTFSGPATRWYPLPALAAGVYAFRCDLHPNMTGRLHAS
jgi:plastocyanin